MNRYRFLPPRSVPVSHAGTGRDDYYAFCYENRTEQIGIGSVGGVNGISRRLLVEEPQRDALKLVLQYPLRRPLGELKSIALPGRVRCFSAYNADVANVTVVASAGKKDLA